MARMRGLTPELKKQIEALSYEDMLRIWRFEPSGHPLLIGEVGEYFSLQMDLKRESVDYVEVSKRVGFQK